MQGRTHRSVYAATKSGMIGYTRTWALELGHHGITVNTVAPGPIATELFDASNPPGSATREKLTNMLAVKRQGADAGGTRHGRPDRTGMAALKSGVSVSETDTPG